MIILPPDPAGFNRWQELSLDDLPHYPTWQRINISGLLLLTVLGSSLWRMRCFALDPTETYLVKLHPHPVYGWISDSSCHSYNNEVEAHAALPGIAMREALR